MTAPVPLESETGAGMSWLDGRSHGTQEQPARHPALRDGVATRTLHVQCGRRSAWLTGGRVLSLLHRLEVPRQWDSIRRQWCVPINRVDDLLAYAEHHEGRFCTVEDVDR